MDSQTVIKQSLRSLPATIFNESKEHACRSHLVRWVEVLNIVEIKLQLGVSMNGRWLRVGNDDVCEIESKQSVVLLYPCLELARIQFEQRLSDSLRELSLPFVLFATFPTNDILEQALLSGSEHWTKLALQWIDATSASPRLETALKSVAKSQDKRLSQQTRQNANRLRKAITMHGELNTRANQ